MNQRHSLSRALILLPLCLLLAAASSTRAQTAPPGTDGPRTVVRSDTGIAPIIPAMFEPLTTGGLLDSLLVTNQPYAAVFDSETVQKAADGTTATTRVVTRVYRDTDGRTRREQTFYPAGATPGANDAAQSVTIYDPVSRWKYSLNPAARTAERFKLPTALPTGAIFNNQVPQLVKIFRQENPQTGAVTAYTLPAPVLLPLGNQTIAGVPTAGWRVTMRVPAGALGNAAAVDATYETWFSLDLKLLVKCTVANPTSGSHTLLARSISRTAPAAALFAVPADYTTREMGAVRTDLPPPR